MFALEHEYVLYYLSLFCYVLYFVIEKCSLFG